MYTCVGYVQAVNNRSAHIGTTRAGSQMPSDLWDPLRSYDLPGALLLPRISSHSNQAPLRLDEDPASADAAAKSRLGVRHLREERTREV